MKTNDIRTLEIADQDCFENHSLKLNREPAFAREPDYSLTKV